MDRNIVDIMLMQYDTFTAAEKKIVDYVLAHQKESQYMSITELSAACAVAISTVSVFCRKLKLAGFNDFKIELARANIITARPHALSAENMDIVSDDSAGDVMQKTFNRNQETLRRTAHMLDENEVERAVALLDQAKQVICLGQGNHAAIAMAAWGQFATASSKFKVMEDSQLQMIALSTLTKDDVVLYFSYSGANLEIMDAVEVIRAVGAKLILVTRFLHSPAAEFADVLLVYGAEEKPLQYGSAGVLISQLYIVDVLMSCYCMHNMEEAEKHREFIGKVLAKKHL